MTSDVDGATSLQFGIVWDVAEHVEVWAAEKTAFARQLAVETGSLAPLRVGNAIDDTADDSPGAEAAVTTGGEFHARLELLWGSILERAYDDDFCTERAHELAVPERRVLPDPLEGVVVDPDDPDVQERARRDGIPEDWLVAAKRSPVYALAHRYRVALPLHPEFRTLPMVWYVPPLSPMMSSIEGDGSEAPPETIFPAIDKMRIPVGYLANLRGGVEPTHVASLVERFGGVVELLGEGLSVSVESGRFVARSQVVGREHRVRTFVETRMSKGHVDVTDDPLLRSLLDSGRARLHARTGPDGAEVRTRSLDVTAEDFHLVDASGRPDPRIIAIGIPAGDVQPGSAIGATPGVPSPLIAGADIAAAQLLTLARETVPVG